MRYLFYLIWGCALLFGADPREIVRRSVEANTRNSEAARNYKFLERQDMRDLDGAGNVKSRRIETWDVTLLEGSPYRRLISRNDQPLSAEEQKAEDEKLRQSNEQRRKETDADRERRLGEWQRRQDRQREPVRELPDAFDFTQAADQQWNGRTVYVIDAMPHPGYKPKSRYAAFFPKVHLRLWIDKQDYSGVRVEMETLDTVSFGGFLLRLAKGSHLVIEQVPVNGEVWLPQHVSLSASARLLLLKGFHREMDFTFSDYKKFQVDSRVVAGAAN